jgi:cytochrome c-type biogenesis protein CcmE
VLALSVAAVLGVFLLYTSIAGGGTPSLKPSELAGHSDEVSLAGRVVAPVQGNARGEGLRFAVRDIDGTASVPVVYKGSVPDMFKVGRDVYMRGSVRNGVFVAVADSLVTKCPSKYAPTKTS